MRRQGHLMIALWAAASAISWGITRLGGAAAGTETVAMLWAMLLVGVGFVGWSYLSQT